MEASAIDQWFDTGFPGSPLMAWGCGDIKLYARAWSALVGTHRSAPDRREKRLQKDWALYYAAPQFFGEQEFDFEGSITGRFKTSMPFNFPLWATPVHDKPIIELYRKKPLFIPPKRCIVVTMSEPQPARARNFVLTSCALPFPNLDT